MRTINQHPQWYNVPLRLSKEQKQNPFITIEEFLECFHLNEVRQLLWHWLVEVISSDSTTSSDPHERNNYFFFYEKMEEMIEASYQLNKKNKKKARKKKAARYLVAKQRTVAFSHILANLPARIYYSCKLPVYEPGCHTATITTNKSLL